MRARVVVHFPSSLLIRSLSLTRIKFKQLDRTGFGWFDWYDTSNPSLYIKPAELVAGHRHHLLPTCAVSNTHLTTSIIR